MRINRAASGSTDPAKAIGFSLPPAMVDKAASRLCWISIVAAISTVLMFAIEGLMQPEVAQMHKLMPVRLTILSVILVSAGYAGLHRTGILSKQALLNLGVFFQIFIAFTFSMFENTLPHDPNQVVRGVSAVGLWLAFCGLLIPNTPLVVLLGSLASASMYPLAHFFCAEIYGYAPLPWNRLIIWVVPLVLMAFWSYFLNERIFRMQIKMESAEELGSYHLGTRIGYGGMGEVWRARHRMLARDAAVKLIRNDVLVSQSGRQASILRKRFEREARVTASLQSPHTVALYDFGFTEDRSFYYVMELLNGVDLQTLVEHFGPLPASRVVHILRQVCDSLEEAHRAGLVHRDIKPKNIFLCRLGLEYDFAKVLDFGLVKTRQQDTSIMTMEGTATGTPAYMPPEVAMGETQIDGRADIYALGCVAYYLLTGSLVFVENSPTALALAHVQKAPIPPSQKTELRIPAELDSVVLQCLEKSPDNRPRSAQELARQLDAIQMPSGWSRTEAAQWWTTNIPDAQQPVFTSPSSSDSDLISADAVETA